MAERADTVPGPSRQSMDFCARKSGVAEEHYSDVCDTVHGKQRVKEVPRDWMERHWKTMAKGKAAGPSRCSADMIAAAPDNIRELIRVSSNTVAGKQ